MRVLLIILLTMVSGLLHGQTMDEYRKLKKAYPDYQAVWRKQHINVDIFFNEDGELNARIKRSEQKLLLNNLPGSYANESVSFSSWEQEMESLKAVCYQPVGNKYKKIEIDKFLNKDELSGAIFYQDISSKNFIYPSTQEGTVHELEYTLLLKNVRFLPVVFTASYIPLMDFNFTISYPKNVNLNLDYYQLEKRHYEIKESGKGKTREISISRSKVPELEFHPGAPNIKYYSPQIFTRVISYEKDGKETPVLRDVSDLHDYYSDWIKDVDKEEDLSLQVLVDSITVDQPTTFDKVKSIYYWVQDNIKYVAFEDGVAGFVPAKPGNVCKSRYGDCKGMAGLTHHMLKLADIPSHLTWIGSRDLPYTYSELPTPSVDNHMITTYIEDGNYYFLDATGGNVPIDQTTSFIQGKQALIDKGDGFEVKEVPVEPIERNYIRDSVSLEIVDNGLVGSGRIVFDGLYRNLFRRRIQTKSEEENKEFFGDLLEKGSNKFDLKDLKILNETDKDLPVIVDYQFTIDDYIKSFEEELYINLNLTRLDYGDLLEEDRTVPYEIDIANERIYKTVLNYDPSRYQLTFEPEPKKHEKELFGFSNTYEVSSGIVSNTLKAYENYIFLSAEHFSDRNTMVKKIRRSFNDSVALTLKK